MKIDFNIIKSNIQFLSNVAVLIGLIWAMIQFYISQWYKSVEKAIELTLFYKNNVLNVFPIINYIYHKCELDEILKKVDFAKVNQFNIKELFCYINKKDIKKFTNYIDNDNFNNILVEVCKLFPFTFEGIDITKDKINKQLMVYCEPIKTKQSYMALLSNIMNDLEYFSTNFNKRIANKNSVYQVIHQSFIKTVELLYAEISLSNTEFAEFKYYTNIIKLYNKWKTKSIRRQNRIIKETSNYNRKVNNLIR